MFLQLFCSSLDANPHHLAPPYCLQLRHANFHPRCLEVINQNLSNAFSQRFEQVVMPLGQGFLDVAHDVGVIEGISSNGEAGSKYFYFDVTR